MGVLGKLVHGSLGKPLLPLCYIFIEHLKLCPCVAKGRAHSGDSWEVGSATGGQTKWGMEGYRQRSVMTRTQSPHAGLGAPGSGVESK